MDTLNPAQDLLDTGRRGMAGVLAGAAWLAWGVISSQTVSASLVAILALAAASLLAACIYCIAKGRAQLTNAPRRPFNRGFLVVSILEGAGVGVVILLCQKLGRMDALPAGIALVIGLHFFSLARVFRARFYHATAAAITLWSAVSWIFLRPHLTLSLGLGVGAILWTTSTSRLLRVLAR